MQGLTDGKKTEVARRNKVILKTCTQNGLCKSNNPDEFIK